MVSDFSFSTRASSWSMISCKAFPLATQSSHVDLTFISVHFLESSVLHRYVSIALLLLSGLPTPSASICLRTMSSHLSSASAEGVVNSSISKSVLILLMKSRFFLLRACDSTRGCGFLIRRKGCPSAVMVRRGILRSPDNSSLGRGRVREAYLGGSFGPDTFVSSGGRGSSFRLCGRGAVEC